ncbi:hypothetical protein GCM10009654_13550 [Streptomyces hebeiensis]|uniref:Uncharacterized protein n=1 Tax=Streptomyces hebeiensis TaxID=229486 RepID=A0ABN1UPX2_9ACTN
MRRLADSLGGLGREGDTARDTGRCLYIVNDHVFPHFAGASRRLRLLSRPGWRALATRTAILLFGLEPLSQSAGLELPARPRLYG